MYCFYFILKKYYYGIMTKLIIILAIIIYFIDHADATYLVEKNSDYNNVEITNFLIDSNLILTGKTNTTFPLDNVNNITGYLIIWNSDLKSLFGLRNLKSVGDLSITHNDLLCFVETIDWSLISHSKIDVRLNNNTNCSKCDNECVGCWGPSPRLCQACSNYMSGITCVKECGRGTIIDNINKKCIEFKPTDVRSPSYILNMSTTDMVTMYIYWNDTYYMPNGVILGYAIYVNDVMHLTKTIRDYIDYDEYDSIQLDTDATIIVQKGFEYKINLMFFTYVGWSNMSESLYVNVPHDQPNPPSRINITIISPYSIGIVWDEPTNVIDTHAIQIIKNVNNVSGVYTELFLEIYTKENSINIENLTPNTNYTINIKRYRGILETNYSTISVVMPYDLPPPINSINITKISDIFLQIEFDVRYIDDYISSNDIDYFVCVVINLENNETIEQKTLDTKCAIHELKQYTEYKIGVYSVNYYGNSEKIYKIVKTKITKNMIYPPEIEVIKDDLVIKTKILDGLREFITKLELKIHDSENGIKIYRIKGNNSLLSQYLNITKSNSYAFQLIIEFVDGSTEESIATQTYADFYKKEFEIGGFSKFWLIVLVSSVGGVLLIILVILLICSLKKNKVGQINTEIQSRKATVIDNKDYINPIYLEISEENKEPIYGDTYYASQNKPQYEPINYEDLNLKNPHNLRNNPAYDTKIN